MNSDAVKYLEDSFALKLATRGRYNPTLHESDYAVATVITSGGVTAVRPMFELIDDHEGENLDGVCWLCVK